MTSEAEDKLRKKLQDIARGNSFVAVEVHGWLTIEGAGRCSWDELVAGLILHLVDRVNFLSDTLRRRFVTEPIRIIAERGEPFTQPPTPLGERALVVRWLREEADVAQAKGGLHIAMLSREIADAIERGEHRKFLPQCRHTGCDGPPTADGLCEHCWLGRCDHEAAYAQPRPTDGWEPPPESAITVGDLIGLRRQPQPASGEGSHLGPLVKPTVIETVKAPPAPGAGSPPVDQLDDATLAGLSRMQKGNPGPDGEGARPSCPHMVMLSCGHEAREGSVSADGGWCGKCGTP